MTTKIIEYAKNKKMYGNGNSEVSGTINIEANGLYGVAKYATANVNVPDTSGMAIEVSELPTPTAEDVGRVYLNTTNGEHYLGEEQVQEFVVGEPLGDKIYFDTSVNPMDYMKPNIKSALFGSANASQTAEFVIVQTDIMSQIGGSNETMYAYAMFAYAVGATAMEKVDFVWVEGKGISIEEFNQAFGISITKFGWQMDELDTSEFANYTVALNNLASYGNLAYKSKTIAFKPLDEPPILQEKTVTENGVVTADAGYDGLSKVTVEVADKGTATLNALIDGSLTEIESGAESVRDYAFDFFDTLQSASFPNATSIGNYGFQYCSSLTNVDFPNATSIGNYGFQYCSSLTNVDFPNATSIGKNAFQRCEALTSISFPNATSINSQAFSFCTALTSVDFPNVTNIVGSAFQNCSTLTNANFPNVTSIGGSAFSFCTALTSVDFPNVTSIGGNAFQDCSALTSVDFPNVTNIVGSTFSGCSALTSVNFPNATTIGAFAFQKCPALTSVNFPNATSLGQYAFNSCTALTSVSFLNIPDIGSRTFYNCHSLVKVVLSTNQTLVATLTGSEQFTNCYHILGTTNATYNPTGAKDGYIYVPLALVADYRVATNWATYATQIMPYVATLEELANIDGTTYDKACVGTDYIEYTYNGTTWEVYTR